MSSFSVGPNQEWPLFWNFFWHTNLFVCLMIKANLPSYFLWTISKHPRGYENYFCLKTWGIMFRIGAKGIKSWWAWTSTTMCSVYLQQQGVGRSHKTKTRLTMTGMQCLVREDTLQVTEKQEGWEVFWGSMFTDSIKDYGKITRHPYIVQYICLYTILTVFIGLYWKNNLCYVELWTQILLFEKISPACIKTFKTVSLPQNFWIYCLFNKIAFFWFLFYFLPIWLFGYILGKIWGEGDMNHGMLKISVNLILQLIYQSRGSLFRSGRFKWWKSPAIPCNIPWLGRTNHTHTDM